MPMRARVLEVEIDASDDWGSDADWQSIADKAVTAGVAVSSHGWLADAAFAASISINLANNDDVQQLNAQWRGKDKPTNVLSFPMIEVDDFEALSNTDDGEVLLGDMILAHQVCTAEAKEKGISLADHVTHLIVHGTLHLLGYDHIEERDGDHMEELEAKALASLGLANPYEE